MNHHSRLEFSPVERREVGLLIEQLLQFALRRGLIQHLDTDQSRNALLDLYGLTEPEDFGQEASAGKTGSEPGLSGADGRSAEEISDSVTSLLEPLLDAAVRLGLTEDDTLTSRDLFDARIMGLLLPRPSETARLFEELVRTDSPEAATDWFYALNVDSNYIRMDRIRKNGYWRHPTEDGELEITVNLSKPEKDPREIARLKAMPSANYPKCLLCKENVGYAGRPDHPARQNLRILPLALQGRQWFFQYSPYVYYNEHSIVFCGEHVPMRISPDTFARLLDFVEQFPHYFIGSNADLPIVGGSILSHDHFQAGRHVFPMELAPVAEWIAHKSEPEVQGGIVQWPLSVLRLRSQNRAALLRVAAGALADWRSYSDAAADVIAATGDTPHNTITPIARLRAGREYELDLVLRNNRTSEEHPDGIFHPHREHHHIKKENIGLIEVMGLAVLPGRLQQEMADIADLMTGRVPYAAAELAAQSHRLNKHVDWIAWLIAEHGTALSNEQAAALLQTAVGDKFHAVLRDAGVFKGNEEGKAAFLRFLQATGFKS